MGCFSCNARGRSCCDHSTTEAQKPSLASIDVVGDIFSQALSNTARRAEEVASGEMSPEEISAADEKLLNWLGQTFSGGNRHFDTAEGWNPDGLAQYLRPILQIAIEPVGEVYYEDDGAVIFAAMQAFLREVYELIETAEQRGVTPQMAAKSQAAYNLVTRWARIMTGAPAEVYLS